MKELNDLAEIIIKLVNDGNINNYIQLLVKQLPQIIVFSAVIKIASGFVTKLGKK